MLLKQVNINNRVSQFETDVDRKSLQEIRIKNTESHGLISTVVQIPLIMTKQSPAVHNYTYLFRK